MFTSSKKITTLIIISLLSISLWQFSTAGWTHSKAIIAQYLLNSSWNKTLKHSTNFDLKKHRPWPWADTWPVAKLIVPQHNIEQIILAGDSGSSLAFGPGYSLASAMPNTSGTTIISAHRDTHFHFLQHLKLNESIIIQTSNSNIAYRVYDIQIVDGKTFTLQPGDEQTLVLVTCYPFEAITTGGSLRYLVYASMVDEYNNLEVGL